MVFDFSKLLKHISYLLSALKATPKIILTRRRQKNVSEIHKKGDREIS